MISGWGLGRGGGGARPCAMGTAGPHCRRLALALCQPPGSMPVLHRPPRAVGGHGSPAQASGAMGLRAWASAPSLSEWLPQARASCPERGLPGCRSHRDSGVFSRTESCSRERLSRTPRAAPGPLSTLSLFPCARHRSLIFMSPPLGFSVFPGTCALKVLNRSQQYLD